MSSYEDSDPSIFAWPQTTLTCVNRRIPLHASSSNVLSHIGGVTLRYSHESQSYVIDGRIKAGESTKSKVRNTIRSHYRWVRQDVSDAKKHKHANTSVEPIQQVRRESNAKWNHTRIKKLREFAAKRRRMQIMKTPNLKQNTIPADSLEEDSSNEPIAPMENSKEKEARTCLDIDTTTSTNEESAEDEIPIAISPSSSKDSYSDESSTSCIPPPPPPPPPLPPPPIQEPQLHVQRSFSDESSLTNNSPTCVTADISNYKIPNKDKEKQILKKGIIKKNRKSKGKVTWWDDEGNRHKPFLLKTDVPMVDDSTSFDLMGRCRMGLPTYDSIDTSSYACKSPKYFTKEFWTDKNEKMQDAMNKLKMMAIDLSESVDEVSCRIDKKQKPEHMNCASSDILRDDAMKIKRGKSSHRQVKNVPITEVIIKGPAKG